jgi:hypothetical protein
MKTIYINCYIMILASVRDPLHLAIRVRERLVVARRQKKHPLHLTFQASEGRRGCVNREPLRLTIRAREGLVVACRKKKHPLRLAFRAREGCVDRENPSVSQFKRGRGWWWCVNKRNPLRLAFRATEGWRGCVDRRNPPSVSRFKRGRGVSTETPPSHNSSGGGVGGGVSTKKTPPSRNLSKGGVGGDVSTKETPLRLAFRAREGLVVVCRQKKPSSISRFERGRGVSTERTPPSHNSSEGGVV